MSLINTKVSPNTNYSKWFAKMKEQIESLTYNDSTYAGYYYYDLILLIHTNFYKFFEKKINIKRKKNTIINKGFGRY